jgi:hypothetical protein
VRIRDQGAYVKLAIAVIMLSASLSAFAAADDRPAPPPASAALATVTPALNALPPAPSTLIKLKQEQTTHRFFDARNSLGLGSVAISLLGDTLSTQRALSHSGFREMNPLARPFVKSRPGAVVYSAGSLGVMAGAMYLAHKTHHHKLERILPFAVAGFEGFLTYHNYHLLSTTPNGR